MRVIFALGLLLLAGASLAEPVHYYKSVHTDGVVTYSDTRPPESATVEEVEIRGESGAVQQEGEQRMQSLEAATKQLDEQRAEQEAAARKQQARLAEARQEVADAQRDLVTVQSSKHNATEERIELAEQRLRLARQRLKEIQGGVP